MCRWPAPLLRGLAVGGLVCGVVFLVLWYLGFLALALFAEPSD